MSKYLETLPQYHFDRDDFCKVFGEVFTDDEIIDIDVMCGYPQNTENFLLTSVPARRKCSLTALSQKPHTTFGLRGSAAKITESLC